MKGDFSRWEFDELDNAAGVLHQQGRILTDADWNQQTRLTDRGLTRSARAAFGTGVAAVAESDKEGMAVAAASVSPGGDVTLEVQPGGAWIDGLLVHLRPADGGSGTPETRIVDYLEAPAEGSPPGSAGTRDLVVLEVVREALSGFQVPRRLMEPALGGVDTTERLWNSLAFHLLRLDPGEDCEQARGRLLDSLPARGRLTVTLDPTTVSGGDCPVVVGGGYTGFEHDLYRIEIARVDGGVPHFKWSQFNGGLVGQGTFDADALKVTIRANRQQILRSGLQNFYLEAYAPYPDRPGAPAPPDLALSADLAEEWRLVYGGKAVLANDQEIDLTETLFGAIPGVKQRRFFFRLWNEVRPVSEFTAAGGTELRDGIRLAFQVGGDFRPGDYWTFPVRAASADAADTLIDNLPPEGPYRTRVPLAVLEWTGDERITLAAEQIEDCRKLFPPLTDLPPGCCVPVPPGTDLAREVEKAVKRGGGCLCLLPGLHRMKRPVDLRRAAHVTIHGYGLASLLVGDQGVLGDSPMFDLAGSSDVTLESFAILCRSSAPPIRSAATHDLTVKSMFLFAGADASALFWLGDAGSSGWTIQDSVLIGMAGLTGLRLSRSAISGNQIAGVTTGLRFSDLYEVSIERNRFIGVSADALAALDVALFPEAKESDTPPDVADSTRDRWRSVAGDRKSVAALGEALLDALEREAHRAPNDEYVGIQASGLFDLVLQGNRFLASAGILGEIADGCVVDGNRFLTTVTGAGFNLVQDLRFAGNRIGEKRTDAEGVHLSPRAGLKISGDVEDCRIEENSFLDVGDAIVFESDPDGSKDVIRIADAKLRAIPGAVDDNTATAVIGSAKETVTALRAETRFAGSSFFALGKFARTYVEANLIQADGTGVSWSGTKDIADFRISRNAFLGCRSGAVVIDPEDSSRYSHLSDPVDTKVRLIDRNRMEVTGVAIRSSIGAVRVEKNDIRIQSTRITDVPIKDLFGLLSGNVFKLTTFMKAQEDKDVGNLRLVSKESFSAAKADAGSIDTKAFALRADTTVLAGRPKAAGDSVGDRISLFSGLARAAAPDLLVTAVGTVLAPALSNFEGFAINLGDIQNEVVDNNLFSENNDMDGGIVFNLPSGMISGNEIQVPRLGLLVYSKAGQARYDVKIEDNKVRVTGPPRGDGKRAAAYALAIPSLTPGNYEILDNHLDGSVMVGAEPFSSSGLVKQGTLDLGTIASYYQPLAFDGGTFFRAVATASLAGKGQSATLINSELIHAALTGVLFDVFDSDPHENRAVIQFSDNRVVRGYVALAGSTGGAFWTVDDLKKQPSTAPVMEINGNIFDYWAKVVGKDVILVGNHSQSAIQYRVGGTVAEAANLPAPVAF